MPKLLIFFGAGASKAFADIPTMKDMVPLFENELKGEPEMLYLYSEIVGSLKEVCPDRLDLEAVFSTLHGIANGRTVKDLGFHATFEAKRLGVFSVPPPSPETQRIGQRLLKKFEDFVTSECEIRPISEENLFKLYSRFSELLPAGAKDKKLYAGHNIWFSPEWAIYTTNYDLCIETVCREAGIEINRGSVYDSRFDRRILRPDVLKAEGFKIVKLHGSLSWYRRQDDVEVEYPEGAPTRGTEAQRIRERVMLYPIEEKAMYEEPYIVLISHFRQDLKTAPKWLFIGYRFNDPFLLRIIEYCSNNEKRVGVLHPEAQMLIQERLTNVRGTKTPFEGRFEEDSLLQSIRNL